MKFNARCCLLAVIVFGPLAVAPGPIARAGAQAAPPPLISDTFSGTDSVTGESITGRAPEVGPTDEKYVSSRDNEMVWGKIALDAAHGNPAPSVRLSADEKEVIAVAAKGEAPRAFLHISGDLCTGSLQAELSDNVMGLGFYGYAGNGHGSQGFRGLILRADGSLVLSALDGPASDRTPYVGAFDPKAFHRLSYSVDTGTGALYDIRLDGQVKTLPATTLFRESAAGTPTLYAGFFVTNGTVFVDNLTVSEAAAPDTQGQAHPPILIRFTLPKASYVTLVIDDADGKRVRNLVSETRYPAGDNVVYWDGLDDLGRDPEAAGHAVYYVPGRMVPPGAYKVRGLRRDAINLRYLMAPYTHGDPPWNNGDPASEWLANHTPPQSALFVPSAGKEKKPTVLIGSYITEGGSGLAWLDLAGRKYHGEGWIGGNWTGAPFLARDVGVGALPDNNAYVGAAFERELRLTAVTPGGTFPVLSPAYEFPAAATKSSDPAAIGGLAVHNGLLIATLPRLNGGRLLFVDVAARQALGTAPLRDGRGVAFDLQGRLLVLSGTRLLRYALPAAVRAERRLAPKGWTASASVHSEDAAKVVDADAGSRWSTNGLQAPGQWLALDLGKAHTFSRLALRCDIGRDAPRAFEVSTSPDGKAWGAAIARGTGTPGVTTVNFPPVTTRWVKVTQTGTTTDSYWSVNALELYDAPAGADTGRFLDAGPFYGVALPRAGWTATASVNAGEAGSALDGDFASRWATKAPQAPGQTFTLDLGAPQSFDTLLMNCAGSDDFPKAYEVAVSGDGQTWGAPVAKGAGAGHNTLARFPAVTARFVHITQTGAAGNSWALGELSLYHAPPPGAVPPTPKPLPAPSVLVPQGLEDPQQLALDVDGSFYVSDGGKSQQVKVFTSGGKFLRAIGHAGAPHAGPYDPLHMNHPQGVTVDSRRQLWVAENDFTPKRVSVWTLDGKLIQAFYGPPVYGGGGEMDPKDTSRWLYGGMAFALDPKTQTARPTDVFYRPGPGDQSLPGSPPQTPLYAHGHQFVTNAYNSNPTGGAGIAGLWQMGTDGVAKPAAAAGRANEWDFFDGLTPQRNDFSVRWTGTVTPKVSETYTFTTLSDDGVRLWVGGKPLIDDWAGHGATEDTGTITLQAGHRYPIRLEYFQGGGGGVIRLSWQSAHQPRALVTPDKPGFRGEYYSDIGLTRLRLARTDAAIDTDWARGLPIDPKKAAYAARLPAGADADPSVWNNGVFFLWTDANGDGQVQPAEVAFEKTSGGMDSVTVMPDLSFVATNVNGETRRYAPTRWTAAGAPLYDASRHETLATGVQHPPGDGGGQSLVGGNGWTVETTAPAPFAPQGPGGVKNGAPLWSYPSLWPGLHPSHISPIPDHPGELIGTTRLIGGMVTPKNSDAGELWAINGNQGSIYVFTTDGLFVATLFRDGRTASWDFPRAVPGMLVNEATNQQEDFWPEWTQTVGGDVYLTTLNSLLVRVENLDTIARLPDAPLDVTPEMLAQARAYFVASEAERQAAQSATEGPLTVALRPSAPTVDGKLDDWAGASWVTVDKRSESQGDWGRSEAKAQGALAISGDRLYAAFRTGDRDLLRNDGSNRPLLFKTGGALDLMLDAVPGGERLLVTQVAGKTAAMLYQPQSVGGKITPFEFASPLRTLRFDRVEDVTSQVVLATDGKGNYEYSVPLALLGLSAAPGRTRHGDLGLLRGNGFQTLQRVYWHNKATGLVSDIPSEAELTPQLWGTWEIK